MLVLARDDLGQEFIDFVRHGLAFANQFFSGLQDGGGPLANLPCIVHDIYHILRNMLCATGGVRDIACDFLCGRPLFLNSFGNAAGNRINIINCITDVTDGINSGLCGALDLADLAGDRSWCMQFHEDIG